MSSHVQRKISMPLTHQSYEAAAQRLQRTVSTIVAPKFSASQALGALLEEVQNCDSMDPIDLLSKVEERKWSLYGKDGKQYSLEHLWNDNTDQTSTEDFSPQVRQQDKRKISLLSQNSRDENHVSKLHNIAQYLMSFDKVDLDAFSRLIGSASLRTNVQSLADYFFDNVQQEWGYFFEIILPLRQLHTMMLIGAVQLISINSLTSWLPNLLLYASFFFMIYFTLKTLHRHHSLKDILAWNKLLTVFAAELKEIRGASNRRSRYPMLKASFSASSDSEEDGTNGTTQILDSSSLWLSYVNFVASLFAFIFTFAFCGLNKVSPTDMSSGVSSNIFSLFALSLLCNIVTVSTVSSSKSRFLTKAWIGAHIFVALPRIFSKLGLLESFLSWTVFKFQLAERMEYRIDLFSLSFIFCIFFYVGYICKNWSAIDLANSLAPQLLGLLWWLLTLTLFTATEFSSLKRIDLALTICLVWLLALPQTGLIAVALVLISGHWQKIIGWAAMLKIIFTIIVLTLPLILTKLIDRVLPKNSHDNILNDDSIIFGAKKRNKFLFIFYAILAIFVAVLIYKSGNIINQSEFDDQSIPKLNWTEFRHYCLRFGDLVDPDSEKPVVQPPLVRQIFCHNLQGASFNWLGRIKTMEVTRIDNFFETIFEYLPDFMDEWLTCFYGQPLTDNQSRVIDRARWPFIVRNCTLNDHNVYTFRVDVELFEIGHSDDTDDKRKFKDTISLTADDTFKDVVLALKQGDEIYFSSKFEQYRLTAGASFKLISIDRLTDNKTITLLNAIEHTTSTEHIEVSREDDDDKTMHAQRNSFWSKLTNSIAFTVNFLISPIGKIVLLL